ncbi:shikimate kinase [Anaerolineales bacterium HSG6]|nr:shikimate kinase [Anaerolineales bacterium HSG6]MDM8530260.1 shikimate kinase [Anaerolineales bacterium HSG25]
MSKQYSSQPNIVLTGFMGTGKSTVGKLLASRLSRPFLDMDELIEYREARTINQIFETEGEPYFRQLEASLCHELAQRSGHVIATGGGALIPPANRQVLAETGLVICLNCQPDILWQRIGDSENRPMLAEQDASRFNRLMDLLAQRQPAYQQIPYQIDVTHLNPVEAADQIMALVETGGNNVLKSA